MRLLEFRVKNYRVLRDLKVVFERTGEGSAANPQERYALDFLAGVNGTGKSTVLHLLGRLFAQLQTDNYNFPVPVQITYRLGTGSSEQREITVSNIPDDGVDEESLGRALRYRVNNSDWEESKLPSNLLPRNIVIYTTGNETAWLDELSEQVPNISTAAGIVDEASETDAYLRELPGHRADPAADGSDEPSFDRPLLFIRSERLPLVALCGLVASLKLKADEPSGGEKLGDVLQSIGLERLAAFSLRTRSQRSLTHPEQQAVLDDLKQRADYRVQQGSDELLVFNVASQLETYRSANDRQSIFDSYESQIALFQRLNSLYDSRPYHDVPLQEVNLFFKRAKHEVALDDVDDAMMQSDVDNAMVQSFDWLSDGEQSLLGRMALFALFRSDDMLILLDEPEVHFNDLWKREIVKMLDGIMAGQNSHAVITTHSSIALTDVRKEDILVLHRFSELDPDQAGATHPEINTLGADPSDVLVHVFGAGSATGARSIEYIRQQIGNSQTKDELESLREQVAPGYWRYRIRMEEQRLSS